MRNVLTVAILALALTVPAWAEEAGMAKVGEIMIHDGWARASLGNLPNSAAYMTLETHGAGDRLIGASSPAAPTGRRRRRGTPA